MSSHHNSTTLKKVIRGDSVGGINLIIAALIALFIVNIPTLENFIVSIFGAESFPAFLHVSESFNALLDYKITIFIEHTFKDWVNDGAMTIFFFGIGLEVKREIFDPKGELNSRNKLLLPTITAIGGIAVPALIFYGFNMGDALALKGWAIPTATDIAFALGVLMLVGVKRVPLTVKVFFLAIAVLDDLGAVVIIALFYGHEMNVYALIGAAMFLAALGIQNYRNSNNFMSYILLGVGLWFCVLNSGIHATVAGVLTALMIPATARYGARKKDKDKEYTLLKTWEHELAPINAWIILPLFALANAGVSVAGISADVIFNPITLGITCALAFGKPIGIVGLTLLATKFTSLTLPEGMKNVHLYGIGLLAGIGFTMSIFVAGLAYHGHDDMEGYAKLAILFSSFLMGIIGYLFCRFKFPDVKEGVEV